MFDSSNFNSSSSNFFAADGETYSPKVCQPERSPMLLPVYHLLWRLQLRWADVALPAVRLDSEGIITRTAQSAAFALVYASESDQAVAQLSEALRLLPDMHAGPPEALGAANEWEEFLLAPNDGVSTEDVGPAFKPFVLRDSGRVLYIGSVRETVTPPNACSSIWLLDDSESFLLTTENALHATTRMLLGHVMAAPPLARVSGAEIGVSPRESRVVLDYGCGSAILSLAALAVGLVDRAHAVDVHEPALQAARRNGLLSGFDETQLRLWLSLIHI